MDEKGCTSNLTEGHTDDAKSFVWKHTREVLQKAGIDEVESI